jgi:hypothetical protein
MFFESAAKVRQPKLNDVGREQTALTRQRADLWRQYAGIPFETIPAVLRENRPVTGNSGGTHTLERTCRKPEPKASVNGQHDQPQLKPTRFDQRHESKCPASHHANAREKRTHLSHRPE